MIAGGDSREGCLDHPSFYHRSCDNVGRHRCKVVIEMVGMVKPPLRFLRNAQVSRTRGHETVPPEVHTALDAEVRVLLAEGDEASDMGRRVIDRHAILVDDNLPQLSPN